jgi:hypothetical protein
VPRLRPISRDRHDVLIRRPWLDEVAPGWRPPVIDIIDQLEELASLLRRGLLSRDEFDRQKRKVLSS